MGTFTKLKTAILIVLFLASVAAVAIVVFEIPTSIYIGGYEENGTARIAAAGFGALAMMVGFLAGFAIQASVSPAPRIAQLIIKALPVLIICLYTGMSMMEVGEVNLIGLVVVLAAIFGYLFIAS